MRNNLGAAISSLLLLQNQTRLLYHFVSLSSLLGVIIWVINYNSELYKEEFLERIFLSCPRLLARVIWDWVLLSIITQFSLFPERNERYMWSLCFHKESLCWFSMSANTLYGNYWLTDLDWKPLDGFPMATEFYFWIPIPWGAFTL